MVAITVSDNGGGFKPVPLLQTFIAFSESTSLRNNGTVPVPTVSFVFVSIGRER